MAVLTATFEAGVDTATITTSAGEGSATPWDEVNIGADNAVTYDATYAADGSLSAKLAEGGTTGMQFALVWDSGTVGTVTEYYGRAAWLIEANPSSAIADLFHYLRTGGTGGAWGLKLNTDGTLTMFNQVGGTIGTTTSSVTTGDWFRVEWYINHTSGDVDVRLYNDVGSSTLTDSIATNVGAGIGADANSITFGVGPLGHTVWVDAVVANETTWPGPITAPVQTLLPSADSVDGAWTDQAGGTSLAAAIDEASFDDADYIRSELNPSASGCRVKLSAGGDPHLSTDHLIHWRTGKIGSATINMTVKLYQGGGNSQGAGTLIATFNRNGVGSLTTYEETLSSGEADAITDYTDLYLEFFADAP